MNRILGQFLALSTVAIGATTFTPACAENDTTLFIRHAMAPPTNRANGGCLYSPDATLPAFSEGVFDFAIRDNYVVFLLVGSQLAQRGDVENARTETNRTHINGAVVRVTDPNGFSLAEFTTVTASFVDPGESDAPTYGVVPITAIDAPSAAKVSAGIAIGATKLVIVNIKVFGTTLGGVDVESGEFQFPIRLCNQCLLDFRGGDDPATVGKDCNLPLGGTAGSTATAVVSPCNAGQDETTACQFCKESRAVCNGL